MPDVNDYLKSAHIFLLNTFWLYQRSWDHVTEKRIAEALVKLNYKRPCDHTEGKEAGEGRREGGRDLGSNLQSGMCPDLSGIWDYALTN